MIAPFLVSDMPALVLQTRWLDGRIMRRGAILLVDHEFRLRRFVPQRPIVAVDLDADGLFEMLGYGLHRGTETDFERVDGPFGHRLYDPIRDTTSDFGIETGHGLLAVDGGGAEGTIIITREIHPETRADTLRAYGPAEGTWASGWRFFHDPLIPYLYTPDGDPASGPVSWRHTGMYRAVPSSDWWTGRHSDLVVRIAEVCDLECERGALTAWVQVGNQGLTDVLRPLRVRLYAEKGDETLLVAEQRVDRALRQTWMPAEPIRFATGDYDRLRAVVDGDGWEPLECDTENNEDVWELGCG